MSSLSQAGGLKLAAKRTAFGDLSNTSNLLRPSKDDSSIGAKGESRFKENLPPIQEKKAAAFQKPAQRPVSVSGLKSLLNNVTNNAPQPVVKQPLEEIQQQTSQSAIAHPTSTRPIATNKTSTVFKDKEQAIRLQPANPSNEPQKPLPLVAPVAPVHRELPPRPSTQTSCVPQESKQKLRGAPSKYIEALESLEAQEVVSSIQTTTDIETFSNSDGVYIDDRGDVQVYDCPEILENYGPAECVEIAKPIALINHHSTQIPLSDEGPIGKTSSVPIEQVRRHKLAPVSEPEEYWEEEDPAEIYDEEGYVTARSFKSRGENTTGGATTILFPKQTQKAKKEIALAKELIEGSKTAEELEDEAWDTTMVAEYGDEIFQYMKDLEVCELS